MGIKSIHNFLGYGAPQLPSRSFENNADDMRCISPSKL